MSDLCNRLMDISDPVVVSYLKEQQEQQEHIPEDMAGLFKKMSEPKNFEEVLEDDIVTQFNISLCEDESSDSEQNFISTFKSILIALKCGFGVQMSNCTPSGFATGSRIGPLSSTCMNQSRQVQRTASGPNVARRTL